MRLKKLADKIYAYSNRRAKKISLTIEINHFRSLQKLITASGCILNEDALIYHQLLLNDVIEQGVSSFDARYFFELKNYKNQVCI